MKVRRKASKDSFGNYAPAAIVALALPSVAALFGLVGWFTAVRLTLLVFSVIVIVVVVVLASRMAAQIVRNILNTVLVAADGVVHRLGRLGLAWRGLEESVQRAVVGAVIVTAIAVPTSVVVGPSVSRWALAALAPTLAAWSSEVPAYNAFLTPRVGVVAAPGDVQRVRAGQETTLLFGIAPKSYAGNLLKASPDKAIARSEEALPLTVTLACNFCAPHPQFLRRITFLPKANRSEFVEFTFVPRRPRDGVSPALVVSVVRESTGQVHDTIAIPIAVTDGEVDSDEPAAVDVAAVFLQGLKDQTPPAADLVLFALESEGKRVTLQLLPIAEDLRRLLNMDPLAGAPLPVFTTGVVGRSDLAKTAVPAYERLAGISLQPPVAEALANVRISDASQASSKLQPDESVKVRRALGLTGRLLYSDLFVEGADARLKSAIEAVERRAAEAPADRPLRMHILTDVTLPWQYLHPPGEEAAKDGFWGLQFALTVSNLEVGTSAAARATPASGGGALVFARYANERDASVGGANAQIEMLRKLSSVDVVDNSEGLLKTLKAKRDVAAIVTFLHASAGVSTPAKPSARLYFADNDWLVADELQGLHVERSADDIRRSSFLRAGPVVILNACETGPSTRAQPQLTFDAAMFKLGATGVVVTEVPVWIPLADEVGRRLIRRLGGGEPVDVALTLVRRELADKNAFDNPLGLLYAYYGRPGARLQLVKP